MAEDITKSEILDQLKRILDFKDLSKSYRLKKFLSFVVDKKLRDESLELSSHNIALNVFDRDKTFDSSIDPIVRVQAGKLRRLLRLYYSTTGKNDKITIEIPKGGYEPEFKVRDEKTKDIKTDADALSDSTPTIAVLPFKILNKSDEFEYLANGIGEELSNRLTFFQELNVLAYYSMAHIDYYELNIKDFLANHNVDYLISGNLSIDDDTILLNMVLSNTISNKQLWAKKISVDKNNISLDHTLNMICEQSLSSIGGAFGTIARDRSKQSKTRNIGSPS